jgi:hypothetical protein
MIDRSLGFTLERERQVEKIGLTRDQGMIAEAAEALKGNFRKMTLEEILLN